MAVLGNDSNRIMEAFRNGADINHVFERSMGPATALCAASGNTEMMRALLKAGANPNIRDPQKGSPLDLAACTDGDIEQVDLLLSFGADSNGHDADGWTSLMLSMAHHEIVELLVEKGGDVNATDIEGWSALMAAVRVGSIETVRYLIRKGASVQAEDAEGNTALSIARKFGRTEAELELETLLTQFQQSGQSPPEWLADSVMEINNLASQIISERWRMSDPLRVEIAMGFIAFVRWMYGGKDVTEDPQHYENVSNSTRFISLFVVSLTTENMRLVKRIRKLKSGFDPNREIILADTKPAQNHPIYGESACLGS